jgi:hypothetical protein
LFGLTGWFDGNQKATASMRHRHRAEIWHRSESAAANNFAMRPKNVTMAMIIHLSTWW